VLVLATITRRYRLELMERHVPAPVGKITLRPGRELPMRLLRRLPHDVPEPDVRR
jgi:hypothetical protein